MKVQVAATYNSITLKQYVDYHNAIGDTERVMVATGCSRKVVDQFQVAGIDAICAQFEEACVTGTPMMRHTFVIGGQRLGFIPDLNSVTLAEYVDADTYAKSIWKGDDIDYTALPKLMAVLFRPVQDKLGELYTIKPYDSGDVDKYMPEILQMNMGLVNGALVFFSTIATNLYKNSVESLNRTAMEMIAESDSVQTSVGTGGLT